MKTQPLKGMRDLLPREQALRDYIQGQILATYRAAGFQRISTPILEDMENLDKSDGGDNLNLIFKVLKRGDKLEHALASGDEKQLSDMGLRYDLTLPLSRYYAANRNELPSPFKVIQTDRVYRAERPQKGRLREFVQCDIDILGDSSPNAEVELIDVTARALLKIGFTGFTVNINDRRILRAMLEKMGFAADQLDSVCISFDKMDKIGADGVKAELTEKGFAAEAVQALDDFLRAGDFSLDTVAARVDDEALTADLRYVIAASEKVAGGRYGIAYAPSLVRGQGYYTGMVFEVTCPQFSGAVAGGGRYDGLIKSLGGPDVPGVGFACGMERLALLMKSPAPKKPDFYTVSLDPSCYGLAYRVSRGLRLAGLTGELGYASSSMKAAMRQAGKSGARYAIIIGSDELARNVCAVKNMDNGNQEEVAVENLASYISTKD